VAGVAAFRKVEKPAFAVLGTPRRAFPTELKQSNYGAMC